MVPDSGGGKGARLLAFTFPGQGSQRPGMGAAWVDHPSFELVALASEITGRDLAHLLLEADQETLTRTDNAQIATFVQSLIVLDAAERIGIEPSASAGHSLGEYTALVAAGSLDFEDGLRLVSERGAAMQEAAEYVPGTMIAVLGLDDETVETACRRVDGDAWIANFNAPGQVIVAGTSEALAEFSVIAKELGAKRVLSMPVGGAFHTPLMAGARDRLRKALGATTFHAPDPVVVANVDARIHDDPDEWPQLLSAQLCSPVRWRQCLDTLLAEGMQTFVELGPGGVLTGLLRRAAPTTDTVGISVSTPDDLDHLVEILANGIVGAAPAGERFHMTERLVVSPAVGLFEPAEGLDGYLPGGASRPADAGLGPSWWAGGQGRHDRGPVRVLGHPRRGARAGRRTGDARSADRVAASPDPRREDLMRGAKITGWGLSLPDTVVTNADFEARLDTSDKWIVERTGIKERRHGGTTSGLAIESARRALERAGRRGAEIDLLVLATTTPDQAVPATSAWVHHQLGCRGAAFDLNAACAGFVYGLVTAVALLDAGHERALVIGSDTLSLITDQNDRNTAVLFGDGAGAIVVEATESEPLILAHDLGLDGSLTPILYCDKGGYIFMEGREVFRKAVRATVESAERVLKQADLTADEIALFIPHQANIRIIDAVGQRLGIDPARYAICLDHTGNTSAASCGIALAEAADAGRLKDGDLVLFSGFGAGMTWASAVVRWGGAPAAPATAVGHGAHG